MTVTTEQAYRTCEEITRAQARNFSYGIRLLPPTKRRALSAVYALSRRIDDIGDGDAATPVRLAGLATVRTDLAGVGDGAASDDPVLVAVAAAARELPIPLAAFGELLDGCEDDVRGASYQTFADLVTYCRRVAGSVGRLSLGVFGPPEGVVGAPEKITDPDQLLDSTGRDPAGRGWAEVPSADLADVLGVALQLTNILRDILEDRRNGRVYLPAEDLDRFGCTLALADGGALTDRPEALVRLIRFEAERAERWYAAGLRLLPRLDRRSAACTAAMAGIYHRLLGRIHRDPLAVTRTRVSLPRQQKALVAARALIRGAA
jgi:phytoene synthase